MTSLRKFTKRFFILLNIVVGVLFLLACCNAFLHPDKWWLMALLAFFFPLFLIILVVFLIFWIFVRPHYILISLICLLTGWKNIHAFFGFSPASHDFTHKDSASIRIMTWNVRSWDEFTTKKIGASHHRLPMLELVGKQNADILCFQEFYEPADTSKSNIRYIKNNFNSLIFSFRRIFIVTVNKYETGVIIFSKYPIVSSSQTFFKSDIIQKTESLIAADINVNGKMIRVFTTHLQSVLI